MIILRKLLSNKRALFFLNGFMLATMLYLYIEDSYEKYLFETLAFYVKNQAHTKASEKDILINSLHVTHTLVMSRTEVFGGSDFFTVKSSFFRPVTYDLMTANSACGSYAFILSRLLSELHVPNRIAQMSVKGKFGGHMLIEAQTQHGWIVLDPFYDLCFARPDGNLASFADVHNNWVYYSKQVPADYNTDYSYEGVRYTNWQKIPVVMPFFKSVLTLFWGKEKTDSISLRVWALRKFHFIFLFTAGIYLLLLLSILRLYLVKPIANLIASLQHMKGPKWRE